MGSNVMMSIRRPTRLNLLTDWSGAGAGYVLFGDELESGQVIALNSKTWAVGGSTDTISFLGELRSITLALHDFAPIV
ncbi:MAG: hypothetical protein Phog2KO_49440 [Phototrophicaceae bacterium]